VEVVAAALTTDPLIGTMVGRWRIERVLGEGGMGRVYLAVQPVMGGRVAIKVLSESCSQDAELVDRFMVEARVVNVIRHENIVNVIDLSQLDDGRPYLVMECVSGVTLGELARRGPQPLGLVTKVVSEVLSALAAAHAHGVIHRDLKPGNVLVTAEGHAKVLDFGIAKIQDSMRRVDSPHTRTGSIMGTPAYMSPEQVRSGEVDGRADLYAAGVMMFEAITGNLPFPELGVYELMNAHVHSPVPSVREVRPDVSPALEAVIKRAMAKRADDRYQTATEMREALDIAARGLAPAARAPQQVTGGQTMRWVAPEQRPTRPARPSARSASNDQPTQFRTSKAQPRRSRGGLAIAAMLAFAFGAFGTSVALYGCDVREGLDEVAAAGASVGGAVSDLSSGSADE